MRTNLARAVASASAGLLLATAMLGCGGSHAPYEPGHQGVITVEIGEWQVSESVVPSQNWPWPGMTDVPAFPGSMRVGGSFPRGFEVDGQSLKGITIDFTDVSTGQFRAYVMLLRQKGFTLSGLVYYNSDSDAAARRGAAGDVDRVVATKGTRRLTIHAPSPPDATVTFEFDGLTEAELAAIPTQEIRDDIVVGPNGETYKVSGAPIPSSSASMPTMPPIPGASGSGSGSWPANWSDRVPAPQGCLLGSASIKQNTPQMLAATCAFPDSDPAHHQDVVRAYKANLLAAGFSVDVESKTGDVINLFVASKGSVQVSVVDSEPSEMTIAATDM